MNRRSKQWRCPHCGKETITLGDRFFSVVFEGRHGSAFGNTQGIRCRECGGMYHPAELDSIYHPSVEWLLLLIHLLVTALLVYLTACVSIFFIFVLMLCAVLARPCQALLVPMVAYDRETCKRIIPDANAVVTITDSSKLKRLMIYGVQTKNAGNEPQLTKHFDRGVFAAMFLHSEKNEPDMWHIYIIKKEVVPPEVLGSGKEFIVTFKGEEIGTGVFV